MAQDMRTTQAPAAAAAASSSNAAAAATSAAAPASKNRINLNFAITDAIRPRIAGILADLQDDVKLCDIAPDLATVHDALLQPSHRSVAEVDRDVKAIFDSEIKICRGVGLTPMYLEEAQQQWRKRITRLARSIVRKAGSVQPLEISSNPIPTLPAVAAADASSLSTPAAAAFSVAAAASTAAAAIAACEAAAASQEWTVPDLAITDATRPLILNILNDLSCAGFHDRGFADIKDKLLRRSLRDVADVNRAIDRFQYNCGAERSPFVDDHIRQVRQRWRTMITRLAQTVRVGALPSTPSTSAASASVHPPAAAASSSSSSSAAAAAAASSAAPVSPKPVATAAAASMQAAPALLVKVKLKLPAAAAAAAPTPAAPAAASAASTSSTPSPAPVSTGALSIAPDPAFYTPERLAELSAELDPSIALNSLVQKLLREDIHDYFRRPVTITADIADYVTKIPRPMDLGTLKKQLLANHYPTYRALCDDIELIWGNAIGYNGPTHAVSNAAAFMRRKAHNYTLEMLAAHAHAEANKNKMPEALRKHATALFPPIPMVPPPTLSIPIPTATSSSSAAASSVTVASGLKEWIVPDLVITRAIRSRVVSLLLEIQDSLPYRFPVDLTDIMGELLSGSLHSVADVDRAIEKLCFSSALQRGFPAPFARPRLLWRTKITELVDQLARESSVLPASSASAAAASVDSPAAAASSSSSSAAAAASSSSPAGSTPITAAAVVPMQAGSASSSAAAVVVPASAAASTAAASLPPSSAADRVERSLVAVLGGSVLADLTDVLQQARQYSSMHQRIAELEADRASLLASRGQHEATEKRLSEMEQQKLDSERALAKTTQLKRKRESELTDERKKLRATEQQLEQKDSDLNSQRVHLAAVADQLAEQRAAVAGLEQEHAELMALLHKREDSTVDRLSRVKLEKAEAQGALAQSTQLKRKAEEERDEAHKKLRSTTEDLERKTEQLEQLDCVACMNARACVLYLPCECAPHCAACDADFQGGPNRAAAAGRRSCPKCRRDIVSAHNIAHPGQ